MNVTMIVQHVNKEIEMAIIYMRSVPGKPKKRALTQPLQCLMPDGGIDMIPVEFEWDGSSGPVMLQGIFPRWRHPISSCKHDYRCSKAKNRADRKFADKEFHKDVQKTSWWITAAMGYAGVRIGSYLGIGNNF